jgi:hypothetical protein
MALEDGTPRGQNAAQRPDQDTAGLRVKLLDQNLTDMDIRLAGREQPLQTVAKTSDR